MWSPRHTQVVSELITQLPAEAMEPARSRAARLGALPIGWDMGADYYLRPSGDVVIVSAFLDEPETDILITDPRRVLSVLAWGTERYPELKELLPTRGPDASDCECLKIELFQTRKAICPECCGLGWVPADHQYTFFS